ncbi:MAG: histidine kinase [Cyclobacteriaceae bacterium]
MRINSNIKITFFISILLGAMAALEATSVEDDVFRYKGPAWASFIMGFLSWMTLFVFNECFGKYITRFRSKNKAVSFWLLSFGATFLLADCIINLQFMFIRAPNNITNIELQSSIIYASIWLTVITQGQKIGYDYFTKSRNSAIENERLKKKNAENKLSFLKQQINPHFLHNSLNTLVDLIEEEDQGMSVYFVKQFSSVYRYVLDKHLEDLVPLYDELEFLKAYLHILEQRFKSKLSVLIDLPEEVMSNLLPPLSLQILIENAIKHNEVSKEYPLVIRVHYSDQRINVENRIKSRKNIVSHGLGLKNLNFRLSHVVGEPLSIVKNESIFCAQFLLKKS